MRMLTLLSCYIINGSQCKDIFIDQDTLNNHVQRMHEQAIKLKYCY
jgi:hypothetical protein